MKDVSELIALYRQSRHYWDEYKAYDHHQWHHYADVLVRTFYSVYHLDMETGEISPNEKLTAEECTQLYDRLEEAVHALEPLHDPQEDKIYIWDGDNMPWDLGLKEDWSSISHDDENFRPHLVPFLQEHEGKYPAVLITGGSFRAHNGEGFNIAEFYQAHGYNAFVLNNRAATGAKIRESKIRAMDMQRAVRFLRYHAEEYGIDPDKIVSNGYSMGCRQTINMINDLGIDTKPSEIDPEYKADQIDEQSAHISAFAGVYPALFPYDDHNRHKDWPPSFFVMGNQDFSYWRMFPFVFDLIQNDVPVEFHVFDHVGHGFAAFTIGDTLTTDNHPGGTHLTDGLKLWPDLLLGWLKQLGI